MGPRSSESDAVCLLRQAYNAPYKRYGEIGEGTHTVFLEKNRMQLFREVEAFLSESFKPGE